MSRDSRTGQSDLSSTSKRSTSVNGNLLEPIRSFLQLSWPGRCVAALPPRRVRDPALSQSQRRRAATVQSVIRHSSVPGPSCSDNRPSVPRRSWREGWIVSLQPRLFLRGDGHAAGALLRCQRQRQESGCRQSACILVYVFLRQHLFLRQQVYVFVYVSSRKNCSSSGNKCTFSSGNKGRQLRMRCAFSSGNSWACVAASGCADTPGRSM